MDTANPSNHIFDEQPAPRSGTLNVLTILTFIGCGIAYLGALYNYFTANNYQEKIAEMEEMQDKMEDNELASTIMKGSMEMLEKSYQYRYILLIATLVFTTFCLMGALRMRKQRKSGFPLYIIGELAPLILTVALMGFSLTGGITLIIGGIVAIVFVILYSTQRKYLIYD
jgi:hypothetical protein